MRNKFGGWKLGGGLWGDLVEQIMTYEALTQFNLADYGVLDPYSRVSVIDIFFDQYKRLVPGEDKDSKQQVSDGAASHGQVPVVDHGVGQLDSPKQENNILRIEVLPQPDPHHQVTDPPSPNPAPAGKRRKFRCPYADEEGSAVSGQFTASEDFDDDEDEYILKCEDMFKQKSNSANSNS